MAESSRRPLLLVLAHGVGASELTALRAAGDLGAEAAATPIELPPRPMEALRHELDATSQLRDLGIAIDRSGLSLRPRGRTDETVLEMLACRPTGPAAVTVFEATSVLRQAHTGGAPAALAAARQLGALLARCRERLRRGDPPDVWLVGLGSPHAVHTMFDFASAWRGQIVAPLARELRARVAPGSVSITGSSRRALDIAAHTLAQPHFARHGTVGTPPDGGLSFRARDGVAFGPRRLAARAAHPDEAGGVCVQPVGAAEQRGRLSLAGLLARFWMHAALLQPDEQVGATTPARVPAGIAAQVADVVPVADIAPR